MLPRRSFSRSAVGCGFRRGVAAFAALCCLCLPAADAYGQDAGVPPTQEELLEQYKQIVSAGQEQLQNGDFAAAAESFNEAARRSANNPQILLFRAQALLGLGDAEGAIADLKSALSSGQIEPAFMPQARNLLSGAYLEVGDLQQALRNAEMAIDEDRGNINFYRNLGEAQVLLGDAPGGEKSLSKYIAALVQEEGLAETPDAAEVFRLRGQAYAALGKTAKALADIDQSIEIVADDHETYLAKGLILLQDEEYKPAADALALAIENYEPADPDLPVPFTQAYLTRASALEEYGKKLDDTAEQEAAFGEVKAACEQLLDELSDGPETAQARAAALFRLGVAERLLDNIPAAVKALSDAIDLNPGLGEAYFRRGICFWYLDEPKLALGDFEQGAAINFDSPRSNLWKGRCWVSLGDQREAVKAFSQAVAVSDRYTVAYVHRGLTYLHIGEYQRAVNDFNNAIRLEPTDGENYYFRGVAFSRLGETDRAIKSMVNAIKFAPELLDAYDALEQELRKAGRGSLADEYRREADRLRAGAE
ncbi:MAG: tetratricopeptide repeat protein [Planctomycetota bacterium]